MTAFPQVSDLAQAPESQVLRLWEGLGYYSRARNLHAAAKYIHEELDGAFPSTYTDILKLKGVGPYTAAAIASICFDEPRPVVDGNVFRFASRYFGIMEDTSKPKARKTFELQLENVISKRQPGTFNQAMMEFGATVCTPSPACEQCIFQSTCFAFEKELQNNLPVKTGKTKVRDRYLNYLVFRTEGMFLMKKRNGKDVWQGLYDFHLLEGEKSEEDVLEHAQQIIESDEWVLDAVSSQRKHILSHQRLFARFYEVNISSTQASALMQKTSLKLFSIEEVLTLPKPKLIVNFIEELEIKNQ